MARSSLKNVIKLIDAEKQTLTPEQAFLNDLKRSIELSADKDKRVPSQTYKPSSMNCIRQSYYQLTGAEQDETSTSYIGIGICNSGSDIHERIQRAIIDMQSNGIDCEWVDVSKYISTHKLKHLKVLSQGPLETKLHHITLNMHFMCDGIVRYKSKYYIIEIKSESDSKFYARNGVDPYHYQQGTAYSLSFEIPDVIFIYVSRNNLDMKSFMFTPTDDMKSGLVSYIEECDSYIKKLKTPPIPKNVNKKSCEYCPYRLRCRKER